MNKELRTLERLVPKNVDLNERFIKRFIDEAVYLPHGYYLWLGHQTKNPRLTFLKGCLDLLGVDY